MFLTILKEIEDCLKLNKSLKENSLVKLTWGNASVLSEDGKHVVIKPSGVDFDEIKFSDLCIIELYTGKLVSGMKPSVDTAIHLEIYKAFPEIKSIIHSHSKFATSWAQALRSIPILGTTHADYGMNMKKILDSLSSIIFRSIRLIHLIFLRYFYLVMV